MKARGSVAGPSVKASRSLSNVQFVEHQGQRLKQTPHSFVEPRFVEQGQEREYSMLVFTG